MGKIIVRFLRRGMLKERAGNTAMIFALLTPILVLMGGGAIDLTQISMRQASLQQAADAAAVGAVARSSPGYKYAVNTMTGYGSIPDSVTSTTTLAVFNANWKQPNDTTTPAIAGTSCGGSTLACKQLTPASVVSVNSVITVSAAYTPSFLGLIGQKSIKLNAVAQASDNIPVYMNFYMLLDNTPSMGLAATTTGQAALQKLTPDQCAFACHDVTNANANTNSYYTIARNNNIPLRIDNVALATQHLLTTAQSTETANGLASEFQVAIYDFGAAAQNPMVNTAPSQVFPTSGGTSADLASAGTAASKIDLMTVSGVSGSNDQWDDRDTNINYSLSYAASNLTYSGTGVSAQVPQNVLFIVSDGVNDMYSATYNTGRSNTLISSINTTSCTTLKNNGVKIAVLYTTYLPVTNNSFWQQNIAANLQSWYSPWAPPAPNDTILKNMTACASPGLFKEVDSGGDIDAAMQLLFQAVVASVRITN